MSPDEDFRLGFIGAALHRQFGTTQMVRHFLGERAGVTPDLKLARDVQLPEDWHASLADAEKLPCDCRRVDRSPLGRLQLPEDERRLLDEAGAPGRRGLRRLGADTGTELATGS